MAKSFSEAIFKKASNLLTASKSLDYEGIIANDVEAVAQLSAVLDKLSIERSNADESLGNYASKLTSTAAYPSDDEQAQLLDVLDWDFQEQEEMDAEQRRQQIAEAIAAEGLQGHIGKVYNSFASDRVLDFKSVPHQRGLPSFDLVFAADYSPIAGLHGIFINAEQVMSIVLPSDTGLNGEWQIIKSREYQNQEEMMEFVTLLSAGFELP